MQRSRASNGLLWKAKREENEYHDSLDIISPSLPASSSNRRSLFLHAAAAAAAAVTVAHPLPANAGIDPKSLERFAVEGDTTGAQTRLRQIEQAKIQPDDVKDIPYTKLSSGVSYREFREGRLESPVVQPGSKVGVQMTIRCRSFATNAEPGGLQYYSTKADDDFNELAWTIGSGQLLPELEEGMMGMHKGALRRIEVPSTAVFAARKENQLPLPKDTNKDGKRRFDNLFKTDATLLFEVLVTRVK